MTGSSTSKLSTMKLTLSGVGVMVGAGIYGTIGNSAKSAGGTVWLSCAVSAMCAFFTCLSFAFLASRHPRAGGLSYVASQAFKTEFLAFAVGLSLNVLYLVVAAACSMRFPAYLSEFVGSELSPTATLIALFIFIAVVNVLGVDKSAWLNNACTLVEVGCVLLLVVVGAPRLYSPRYNMWEMPATTSNPTGTFSWQQVLSTSLVTFFAFGGFESLFDLAGHAADPRRSLPRAMTVSLLFTAALNIAVSVVASSVLGWQTLSTSEAPLVAVMTALTGGSGSAFVRFIPRLTAFIGVFSMLNTISGLLLAVSQSLHGMALQKLLPTWLTPVNVRYGTPQRAVALVCGASLGIALLTDPGRLVDASGIILLLIYLFANVAAIKLQRCELAPPGSFEVPRFVPYCGAVTCTVIVAAFVSQPGFLTDVAIPVALFTGIGALYVGHLGVLAQP